MQFVRAAMALVSAGAVVLVTAGPANAGGSANAGGAATFHFKEWSQGANVVFSPNCPENDEWLPTVDTICDDYTVWYLRFGRAIDGGSMERSTAPFQVEVDHERDLVHPDGSGELLVFESGGRNVQGSYDKTHLTSATMAAVTVPLADVDLETGQLTPNGRSAVLGPFTWTAASKVYEWGNDGPVFGDGPRHYSTRCETGNFLAHQKDTAGYVTGTLNGVSLSSFSQRVQIPGLQPADATGYIFNNWFHIDTVTHCYD